MDTLFLVLGTEQSDTLPWIVSSFFLTAKFSLLQTRIET